MVTLTKNEYKELKKKADNYDRILKVTEADHFFLPNAQKIDFIQLKGKAAKKLDRRVEQVMKEYRAGKTKIFKTLP